MTGTRLRVADPASFEPVLASIPMARGYVLEHLQDLSVDRDVALLLTSELVTNAIRHASTSFCVEVRPAPDGGVRITVGDADPTIPRPMTAPPEAQSGRGLFFVEQYATSWGVEPTEGGKQVWFELGPRH